ncbi:MAG: hypothetical protein WCA77_01595, partial [Thermoplasmata archaeon]
ALIQQYLGTVRANNGHAPVPDRAEIERLLLSQMDRAPTHLVLVLERREETQLDYLMNGVVETGRETNAGRLERWLHLPKLRGIRVANASYPYTVEGARFECIEPVRPYHEMRPGPAEREPDRMPGHIWPGSHAFAENFGRLPVGKLSLIEIDGEVPDYIPGILINPMIASVVSGGGRVVSVPPSMIPPKEIFESLNKAVPKHQFLERFRLFDASGQTSQLETNAKSEFSQVVIQLKDVIPSAATEAIDSRPTESPLARFMKEGAALGNPALVTMFVSGLQAMAAAMKQPITEEVLAQFPSQIQTSFYTTPMHGLVVGPTGAPLFERLRRLAGLHLHLSVRLGRIFIYGSNPWTPAFVMTEGQGNTPYDLLRIV